MRQRLVKPGGQIVSKHIVITVENKPKSQFSEKTYNQVNWFKQSHKLKLYLIEWVQGERDFLDTPLD